MGAVFGRLKSLYFIGIFKKLITINKIKTFYILLTETQHTTIKRKLIEHVFLLLCVSVGAP